MDLERVGELVLQPLAVALDDAELEPLLDRLRAGALFGLLGLAVGERRQQFLQRITASGRF